MSGLETLSLVANIFQVIGFACDTVGLCKAIYRGELPDAILKEYGDSLSTLSAQVQTQCNNSTPQTKDEKALADLAAKCNVAARALADEADFLTSHQAKGSLVATLKIVTKTKWRQRRLERLEKSLDDYRKILETQLLVRLCTQSRAGELRLKDGFDELDKNLRDFISNYAAGNRQLTDLVRTQIGSLVAHTASQGAKTQQTVNAHTTVEVNRIKASLVTHVTRMGGHVQGMSQTMRKLNVQAASDERRDRLLRSLKYPGMNARRNQVTASHVGTFGWILDIEDDSDDGLDDGSDDGSDGDSSFSSSSPTGLPLRRNRMMEQVSANDDSLNTLDLHRRSDNFSEWLKSDNDLFWISGKPGSGKSTLVKFLLGHRETKKALDVWRSDSSIMSHFLWKPGSEMQNNVKGLICSLLHQALSLANDLLSSILATSPRLTNKDEHTDWSLEELSSLFTAVFSSYPTPICVFIDGLDEICERDGVRPLMRIVDNLCSIPYIKVCVSSRPEPRFLKLLGSRQHIRLQDLTSHDMWRFAHGSLEPHLKQATTERGPYSYRFQPNLLDSLIEKAEGVFLWLHLAIQSLIRGFENGDDQEDLLRRLKALPGELTALYSEMWARLNGDVPLYRESTARYLNLILDGRDIFAEARNRGYMPMIFADGLTDKMSFFALVASTQPHIQEVFLDDRGSMPPSQINDICAKTRDSVSLRSAGLVEILPRTKDTYDDLYDYPEFKAMTEYGVLQVHLDGYPALVHRTAYDFLKYTQEGQGILGHDPASPAQRYIQVVRGALVQARISTRLGRAKQQGNAVWSALLPISLAESITLEQKRELLYLCWEWYDNGYLTLLTERWSHLHLPKQHFLAILANCGFDSFVQSELTSRAVSPSLAALILSDTVALERTAIPLEWTAGREGHPDNAVAKHVKAIKHLLHLQPDINTRPGWCPHRYARENPDGPRYAVSSVSTFASLLVRLVDLRKGPDPRFLGLLSTMLTAGADLNPRVPMQVWVSQAADCQRDLPSMSLTIGTNFWTRANPKAASAPTKKPAYKILLDVNLAFLVKILLCGINNAALRKPSDPALLLAFKDFAQACKTIRDPGRCSFSPVARARLVQVYIEKNEGYFQTQQVIVPQSASNKMLQILEPRLFGNDCHLEPSMDGGVPKNMGCSGRVRKEIDNHYKDWEIVSKSPAEFLADEGCGFRWVDAQEFASMMGKSKTPTWEEDQDDGDLRGDRP
ncbi:hypothetical protein QBC42DRAFT_92312 [Cladorrhinum samala]|uniref:Nephrocystin 3-like N-terminal domain-containing protein n=1 Tax=Cladorrhinum samala TaxID=585594 RepID=A0AAV9HRB6_9PEZI|nr:hypothetical protein QBC42DRAFT_92312 [Cladorrhinum samala]